MYYICQVIYINIQIRKDGCYRSGCMYVLIQIFQKSECEVYYIYNKFLEFSFNSFYIF